MSDQDAVTVAHEIMDTEGFVCKLRPDGDDNIICKMLQAAFARGLAARDGMLSREDVAGWIDSVTIRGDGCMVSAISLKNAVKDGAIERFAASRGRAVCAWKLCGVPKTMRANVEHMREWLAMGRVNLNGAWYCNRRCQRAKGGTP